MRALILFAILLVVASEFEATFAVRGLGRKTLKSTVREPTPAFVVSDDDVVWNYSLPVLIYNSVAMQLESGSLAAGTQDLTPQSEIDFHKLSGDGTPEFVFGRQYATFTVATARNAPVFAGLASGENLTCTIYKWSGDLKSSKPDWIYQSNSSVAASRSLVVSNDGSTIAAYVSTIDFVKGGVSKLLILDAATGALLNEFVSPLKEGAMWLALSANGDWAAITYGSMLTVYSVRTNSVRWQQAQSFVDPPTLSISDDATYIANCFTQVMVYKWTGATYALLGAPTYPSAFVGAAAFSPDANSLAVVWTTFNYNQNIVQVFDMDSVTAAWTYKSPIAPLGLQAFPSGLRWTLSGSHFATASWGSTNNVVPQVMAFQAAQPTPIFTATTPGSMFGLDVADNVSELLIAANGKHVHANVMGDGGDLFLWKVSL